MCPGAPGHVGEEWNMASDGIEERIDAIVTRLEAVSLDLNDLAMSLVSEAIEAGSGERPEAEKRVSRARRTVDRAIHQLRGGITTD
jgi:archaellum component FlaC